MSSLLNSVFEIGKAAVQRLQAPVDPNFVKSVSPMTLAPIPTICREESMVLYGPQTIKKGSEFEPLYEIVVHSEKGDYCFSVFRCSEVAETKRRFREYENKVPVLVSLDPSLCNQSSLQSITDLIRENPTYSIAHIAVSLDMKKIIAEEPILRELDRLDNKGVSPLHLAIRGQNMYMINFLLAKNVSREVIDQKGNSIYHYAANTTKEIIEAICENPSDLLNRCNNEGHTPLHIACHNDKPDCVKALLCSGADVNVTGTIDKTLPIYSALEKSSVRCVKEIIEMYPKQLQMQDVKYGGTPLHWATTKEIIEALVESGCLVDARNFAGNTALHVMINRERLDCALALIAHDAGIDLKDNDGNTPLHLAVEVANITLLKALLVFNADTSVRNNQGLTPWDVAVKKKDSGIMDFKDRIGVLFALHAVGACGSTSSAASELSRTLSKEFSKLKSSPTHKRTRTIFDSFLASNAQKASVSKENDRKLRGRLLSLDGGGIKGLVLTTILKYMENQYQTPINHCFDWIAGTSTGGMLALALASGKTVLECQSVYYRLKDKVFGGGNRPYPSAQFEELLQKEFGIDVTMYQLPPIPKVMVTATMADRCAPDLMIFRNYMSPQDRLGIQDYEHPDLHSRTSPTDQLIWKAARASGAAPSFFRPEGNYVDGGILSNNPSLDLLTEITEHNIAVRAVNQDDQVVKPTILVSLGTGIPPIKKTRVVDIFRPDNATDTLKLFMGWDGMGKLMLESILDADGRPVDRCRAWCMSSGIVFHRFSPPLVQDIELDETDDKILVELMWYTMAYCHSKREEIMSMAPLLVYDWKNTKN